MGGDVCVRGRGRHVGPMGGVVKEEEQVAGRAGEVCSSGVKGRVDAAEVTDLFPLPPRLKGD